MHLVYEKYIQRNCGNSFVKSYEKNIACLRKKLYTHRGSVQKNICSYFVSLRQGGGSHENNCLTTYKFEQMFESVFCDIFCFKDNSPKPPPSNFPQNTPPREVILMIFFLLSSRSTGLVVKKQGFFPKPLCSPWPFLQFFWKKQGSHVFFFNVHSLEHFDHFLLPPKNRSFASWFVA